MYTTKFINLKNDQNKRLPIPFRSRISPFLPSLLFTDCSNTINLFTLQMRESLLQIVVSPSTEGIHYVSFRSDFLPYWTTDLRIWTLRVLTRLSPSVFVLRVLYLHSNIYAQLPVLNGIRLISYKQLYEGFFVWNFYTFHWGWLCFNSFWNLLS